MFNGYLLYQVVVYVHDMSQWRFFLKVYKQLEYKQQMTGSEKRIAVGRILMETLKTSHRRWHLSWGMQAEYTSAVTYL